MRGVAYRLPTPTDKRAPAITPPPSLVTPRQKRLWELYRITEEDYAKVLAFQNGVCGISGRLPGAKPLNVDHDHQTGLFRGLLSPWINKGLAFFEDDARLLRAAADYLDNPPASIALGRRTYGLLGRAKRKKKMIYGGQCETASPGSLVAPENFGSGGSEKPRGY